MFVTLDPRGQARDITRRASLEAPHAIDEKRVPIAPLEIEPRSRTRTGTGSYAFLMYS